MMEHHIEILAMNLWLGIFGVTVLRDDWVKWAAANPDAAKDLRDQASRMINVAHSHAKQPNPRHHHAHSLGWLF